MIEFLIMRVSIAQINSTIGAFSANGEKILAFARRAQEEQRADMVLFPEMAICGYPPMDLLDQDSFTEMNIRTLRILQRELPRNIAVGLGYVGRNPYAGGKALVNAYGIILEGKLAFEQIKTLLPTYDVFDEARNFESAQTWSAFEWRGERIGIAICEDVWRETATPGTNYVRDPVGRLLDQGISILCVPSASPYFAGKLKARRVLAERISRRGNIPLVYINAVGANDSIIFDGRSFVTVPARLSSAGTVAEGDDGVPAIRLMAGAFAEDLVTWDSADKTGGEASVGTGAKIPAGAAFSPQTDKEDPYGVGLSGAELDTLEEALVLGIREYMGKCGFTRGHLALSGGIDSALVACLAVKALGKDKVTCFGMPSRFSSRGSRDDAAELAANLDCSFSILPIEPVFESFLSSLAEIFENRPFDLAEENLQARIRGTLMMAYSNKFG
ncbi:MAG: NAD(+) synthase, partial [Spirochaetaceae bacterium]|nr:NAD(+) synthase [Spirochaetaceae bacterium]